MLLQFSWELQQWIRVSIISCIELQERSCKKLHTDLLPIKAKLNFKVVHANLPWNRNLIKLVMYEGVCLQSHGVLEGRVTLCQARNCELLGSSIWKRDPGIHIKSIYQNRNFMRTTSIVRFQVLFPEQMQTYTVDSPCVEIWPSQQSQVAGRVLQYCPDCRPHHIFRSCLSAKDLDVKISICPPLCWYNKSQQSCSSWKNILLVLGFAHSKYQDSKHPINGKKYRA